MFNKASAMPLLFLGNSFPKNFRPLSLSFNDMLLLKLSRPFSGLNLIAFLILLSCSLLLEGLMVLKPSSQYIIIPTL